MIVVHLKGGLGNQMFQYAYARHLSRTSSTKIKLDATDYQKDVFRSYGLDAFCVEIPLATREEVVRMKYPHGLFSKLRRFISFKILRRFHVGFESLMMKCPDNVYRDGFWQSYKYFEDITDTIRGDLMLRNALGADAQSVKQHINQSHAVSIHIRRGDYTSPALQKKYGVLSPDYYKSAIDYITARVKRPTFFVFSDDIMWVREHISFGGHTVVYVSNTHIPDYEELSLMSLCHHHIIANSSFSWWGAWLNPRTDKIVVAPKTWFKKKSLIPRDLIPPSWIRF